MQKRSSGIEICILVGCFVVSRVLVKVLGVSFGYSALYEYWQYLDVESLKQDLLQSLWYQHSQPPVFNFFLGIILKTCGTDSAVVLEYLFAAISLFNALLLCRILKHVVSHRCLPLALSVAYLLSPATILYENELFYTQFTSMLLLLGAHFFIKFNQKPAWLNAVGLFACLALVCLTRSVYHLSWMILVTIIFLYPFRSKAYGKLWICAIVSVGIVAGWYVKNYTLFNSFSTSSWMGMNFSRVVFRDVDTAKASDISALPPFYPIRYYAKYVNEDYRQKYASLPANPVLFNELKNDSFINMNHVGYLDVSRSYMEACLKQVSGHPAQYLQNVSASLVIFFTPASSYFKLNSNDRKIKYYDLACSFNLAHLFTRKHDQKIALAVSAIPRVALYFLTLFLVLKSAPRRGQIRVLNTFIIATIVFVLIASTLFEYGENMRFRYEIEPLFIVLLAQVLDAFLSRRRVPVQ